MASPQRSHWLLRSRSSRLPPPTREVDNDHLIFFGRLETRKGVQVLGEALRQLKREGKTLPRLVSFLGTLVTVNGQPAAEYLDALRQDLGSVEFRIVTKNAE